MLLAALVSLSLAHICLLYPDQRGGANITGPGSHNCYQPQGMCAGVAWTAAAFIIVIIMTPRLLPQLRAVPSPPVHRP